MSRFSPDLSKPEYDVLSVLWPKSSASVREVHDALQPTTGWAYTTTKTVMDRMIGKGLLARDEFHGVYVYRALISKPQGLARWLRFLSERILGQELAVVLPLVQSGQQLTDTELAELTQLLTDDVHTHSLKHLQATAPRRLK